MSAAMMFGAPTHQDGIPRTTATRGHGTILTGMPQVMTASDVAALLGVSEQVVRHLLRTRQLPGRRVGRRWYVPRDLLAAHLGGDGK
jgi:excisionase family DNA binding protein